MSIGSGHLFHNLVARGFNLALLFPIISSGGDMVCITELLASDSLGGVANGV